LEGAILWVSLEWEKVLDLKNKLEKRLPGGSLNKMNEKIKHMFLMHIMYALSAW
jgi:hypothetical protein